MTRLMNLGPQITTHKITSRGIGIQHHHSTTSTIKEEPTEEDQKEGSSKEDNSDSGINQEEDLNSSKNGNLSYSNFAYCHANVEQVLPLKTHRYSSHKMEGHQLCLPQLKQQLQLF